jgi:preprotein translocase subunit SecG
MLLRAMPMAIAVLLLIVLFLAPGDATTIGVNYSTKGDNLLPSVTVASFLANHTCIDRVKLFDGNPNMVRAFTNMPPFYPGTAI